jgi:DNA topoisomerase-1
MERKPAEETGELCPKCGSPLVIKKSKYGKFVACSNYPDCKYIKQEGKDEPKEIIPCPKCGGMIIEKKTRKGKIFYGCNNYPKCEFATWDEPINETCPDCGSILTKKGKKIKCSICNYEK